MNTPGKVRFDTLDAMRGIAALLIVPRHTELFGTGWADSHSYLAVDLFFILSGFVIANAYEQHLRNGTISAGKFVLIRLVRFYPLLLLAVGLAVAVALTRGPFEPNVLSKWTPPDTSATSIVVSAFLAIFFLPSRFGDSPLLFPLNTAFWSLMFEMAVNLLYVLTFRWLTNRMLWTVVIASGLALAALALRSNGIELGWAWGLKSLVGGTVRAVFGFACGVLIFRLFNPQAIVTRKYADVLIVGLAALPLFVPNLGAANGLVDCLTVLVVFPLVVMFGARTRAQGPVLRVFAFLGAVSFAIYVLHVPMLIVFERLLMPSALLAPLAAVGDAPAVFLVLLLASAWALDRFYDMPVRSWLQDVLGLRRRLAAPVPSTENVKAVDSPVTAGVAHIPAELIAADQQLAIEEIQREAARVRDSLVAGAPQSKPASATGPTSI